MKKTKFFSLLLCVFLITAILAACSSGSDDVSSDAAAADSPEASETAETAEPGESSGDGYKIGFSNGYFGNTWRSQMVESFTEAAEEYKSQGIISEYMVTNTNSDATEQNNQINAMIDAGCDAILIVPASATSVKSAVDKALEAGITVVFASDPAAYEGTYCVVGDNDTFQRISAAWLLEQLGGSGNIVQITGEPGASTDAIRQETVAAMLNDYPDINLLTTVPGKWSVTEAQSVMATILASYDTIDGVLTQDVMAEGIIKAYESAGKEVPIMTGDYTKSFFQKWDDMGDSLNTIGVTYDPGISRTALEFTLNLLDGKTLNEDNLVANPFDDSLINCIMVDPAYVVTREAEPDAAWMQGLVGTQAISLEEALELMADGAETASLNGYLSREEVDALFE